MLARAKRKSLNSPKKRQRKPQPRPAWDSSVTDHSQYRATEEELKERREKHRSNNLESVRDEENSKAIVRALKSKKQQERRMESSLNKQQSALLKEILYDQQQTHNTIYQADKLLNSVRDVFGDNARKYTVMPDVTQAPTHQHAITPAERPYMTDQDMLLDKMSSMMMDNSALNDSPDEVTISEVDGAINDTLLTTDSAPVVEQTQHTTEQSLRSSRHSRAVQGGNRENPAAGKRREQVNNERTRPPTTADMEELLADLQSELTCYERQTGRGVTCTTPANSFSGYTAALVAAVTKLLRYFRENRVEQTAEKQERQLISLQVNKLIELTDALTADMLGAQQETRRIQREQQNAITQLSQQLTQIATVVSRLTDESSSANKVSAEPVQQPEIPEPTYLTLDAERQLLTSQISALSAQHQEAQRRMQALLKQAGSGHQPVNNTSLQPAGSHVISSFQPASQSVPPVNQAFQPSNQGIELVNHGSHSINQGSQFVNQGSQFVNHGSQFVNQVPHRPVRQVGFNPETVYSVPDRSKQLRHPEGYGNAVLSSAPDVGVSQPTSKQQNRVSPCISPIPLEAGDMNEQMALPTSCTSVLQGTATNLRA